MNAEEMNDVSPTMYKEFIVDHYQSMAARIGALSFGCCEAVQKFWDGGIETLPNLRKVSISAWCDETFMGERLRGKDIVFLRKPIANLLGVSAQLEEDAVRAHFRHTAQAASAHPDLPQWIDQITIMGGGIYGGNMTMTSEFNIYNDPEAAKLVFASGMKLTMIGLDVTLKPQLPQWVADTLSALPDPHARTAVSFLQFMQRRKITIGGDGPNLHDVMALAAILQPELFTFERYYMDLETEGVITRGMTIADFHHVENRPPNVSVAVDINVTGFSSWFVGLF